MSTGEPKFCNGRCETVAQVFYGSSFQTQPYACPVCNGKQKVPAGFYELSGTISRIHEETCRACNGTGIVWKAVVVANE